MNLSDASKAKSTSLSRDALSAARYYLGNWRVLLILAIVIAVTGVALEWDWLVAVGLAPIVLSTLPCLVMCAFGVCTMRRSAKEQSAMARGVSDQNASLPLSGAGALKNVGSCCQETAADAPAGRQGSSKAVEPPQPDQRPGRAPVYTE